MPGCIIFTRIYGGKNTKMKTHYIMSSLEITSIIEHKKIPV